jgi:hypothetical protein
MKTIFGILLFALLAAASNASIRKSRDERSALALPFKREALRVTTLAAEKMADNLRLIRESLKIHDPIPEREYPIYPPVNGGLKSLDTYLERKSEYINLYTQMEILRLELGLDEARLRELDRASPPSR